MITSALTNRHLRPHNRELCLGKATYATAMRHEHDTVNDDEATPREPEQKTAAAPAGRDTVSGALSTALSTAAVQDNAHNDSSANALNNKVKKTVWATMDEGRVAFRKPYKHGSRSVGTRGTCPTLFTLMGTGQDRKCPPTVSVQKTNYRHMARLIISLS